MKIQLTDQQLSALKEYSKEGRSAWKYRDIEKAESKFLLAWSIIPEPKIDYDYAQSLSRGLVIFYRETRNYEKAKLWISIMADLHGSTSDPSVQFLTATVHFDAGEFDQAYELFQQLHANFGKRPFDGEDRKYLEFFKNRAKGK